MSEFRAKVFAKGAGTSIVGKLTGRGLNFLTQVLLARFLGPEMFGIYAIGWAVLRLVGMIGTLGLDQGVVHFGTEVYKKDPPRFIGMVNFSLLLVFISGLLFGALLFGMSETLALRVFGNAQLKEVFQIFSFGIPFIAGLRVLSSFMTLSQSMKYSMLAEEISQPVIEIILLFVLLTAGFKLKGAVIAAILSFAAAFLVGAVLANRLFPGLFKKFSVENRTFIRSLLRFSLPVSAAVIFGSLLSWVDRLMVGLFLFETEVGIYTTVSLVSIAFVTILSGIKMIFLPQVAQLHQSGTPQQVEELYRVSTKWGLYLSIPIALVIFFAPVDLLKVAFGPEYAVGASALIVLTVAQLVNVGTGALDLLLVMTGHRREWLFISAGMLLSNITMNAVLIPRFGITGAAWSTAVTLVAAFIIGLYWVWHQLKIWPYDRRYLKGLAATVLTVIGLALVEWVGISDPIWHVLLTMLVSFGLFLIGLALAGLDKEDLEVLRGIRGKWMRNRFNSKGESE